MPAPGRPLLEPWDDDEAPGEVVGVVRLGRHSRAVLALVPGGPLYIQRQVRVAERQTWESRGGVLALPLGDVLDQFIAALERGRELGGPEPEREPDPGRDARRYRR